MAISCREGWQLAVGSDRWRFRGAVLTLGQTRAAGCTPGAEQLAPSLCLQMGMLHA